MEQKRPSSISATSAGQRRRPRPWRRFAAIASVAGVFVLLALYRMSGPAFSAPVTPGANQKVTVYSGVAMIVSTTWCGAEYCVLELGNAGRDIASNGEIFIRPNSTNPGTKFDNQYQGKCSTSLGPCMTNGDCTSPQYCIGSQNMYLSGNLTIPPGKELCFGTTKCQSAWSAGGGGPTYWATVTGSRCSIDRSPCTADAQCSQFPDPQTCVGPFTALKPQASGSDVALHIGESIKHCAVETSRTCSSSPDCQQSCVANSCSVTGEPCNDPWDCPAQACVGTGGVAGQPALDVSGTFSPLLTLSSTRFGEVDEDDLVDRDSIIFESTGTGNADVIGTVNTFSGVIVRDYAKYPYQDMFVPVWNRYTRAQTDIAWPGDGADADTFDSASSVPFTAAPFKNVFWKTRYASSYNSFQGSFDDYWVRQLCVNAASRKLCRDGEFAGLSCNSDADCPAYGGGPDRTCGELCLSQQSQCSTDNIWHCKRTYVCSISREVCFTLGDPCDPGAGTCIDPNVPNPQSCRLSSECPVYYECRKGTRAGLSCTTPGITPECPGVDASCGQVLEGCVDDTTFYCKNRTALELTTTPCTSDVQCNPDEYCNDGDVVTYNNAGSGFATCQNLGGNPIFNCLDVCRSAKKCDGGPSLSDGDPSNDRCLNYGSHIQYTNGQCVDSNCPGNICSCRCSLNVPTAPSGAGEYKQVPYTDAKNQPLAGGGDLCSGDFTDPMQAGVSGYDEFEPP